MTGVAYSTRRFTFAAGHRYRVAAWSEAENRRVFGDLTVPHGHNYTLDVTVRGPIDARTGMVIDLAELKRVVGETVVARFDHADLNADPLFRERVPTTENIALAVWDLLAAKLGPDRLWQVRVWEDPTLYVDYRGE
jgi:6-pyruvoyltetrahydropterin/6-carboxytetrahydropterin synthase